MLESIATRIGTVPHVLLRDTLPGEQPSPLIRPTPDEADSTLRYRIDGEIARGGMGAVLKGHDPDLGRDVAIKVLRDDLRDNADLLRRFVEEAQIGGQLQHPGIVPIYELGSLDDQRPFFAMRLVKGQTLADLLAARATPAADVPRFLTIFAAVAQTMAYAHTRGVIHRDLKPSNIMVGAFGEVQVMDWGLAKVLPRGGIVDDARAGREPKPETIIATARSGSDSDQSVAGSVLGTPSYMPPEQAQGEVDRIDERADVFSLGSILAEILTGKPAFTGRGVREILLRAALGDTAEVRGCLANSGIEAELVAIVTACLEREPADRPRNATVVAERITGYQAGVQERVQAAIRERAVAEARAVGERKQRRLQLGLAASVLAITTMGGGGLLVEQGRKSAHAATVAKLVGEVVTFRNLARATPEDPARWRTALAAVTQAEEASGDAPEARTQLAALRREIQGGAADADRDRVLLGKLASIRSARVRDLDKDRDASESEARYAEAFRTAGLDLLKLPPAEVGAAIRARPPGVAVAMVAAIDDWSSIRLSELRDRDGAVRLVEVARESDPDPWRNDLRAALMLEGEGRLSALRALANTAKFAELGAVSLNLMGRALGSSGDPEMAERVLRQAQVGHPEDVWVNFDLAMVLWRREQPVEAIRFFTVARSLRPETAFNLAYLLERQGEFDQAIAVYYDLVRIRPNDDFHSFHLGRALDGHGRPAEAAVVFSKMEANQREVIRRKPDDADAHRNLGYTLKRLNKLDEAVAEYREAMRIDPKNAGFYTGLCHVLEQQNKHDEAVATYREILRINPDAYPAHLELGKLLKEQGKLDEAAAEYREMVRIDPGSDQAHRMLADALRDQGKSGEAAAEYREALRINPVGFSAHADLGRLLKEQGKLDEAVAEYRENVRIDPGSAWSHLQLADALQAQGRPAEAAVEGREAVRLAPGDIWKRYDLGELLEKQGKFEEAIAEYREAVRIEPRIYHPHQWLAIALRKQSKFGEAAAEYRELLRINPDDIFSHLHLGNCLVEQGKFDEAAAEYREVIRIDPAVPYPHQEIGFLHAQLGDFAAALEAGRKAQAMTIARGESNPTLPEWLPKIERAVPLAGRLPAILDGSDRPANDAETLEYAQVCALKRDHAAAARLYAVALDGEAELGDDFQAGHRYNAARSAALAGTGQGKDKLPPDEARKAELRGKALGWLRADLAAWAGVLEKGPEPLRAELERMVQRWKEDADLAAVRDDERLTQLPEVERYGWRAFWAEVDALLSRARGGKP